MSSLCLNCNHSIPDSVFTLHSLHCTRFLTVCPTCHDLIPKSTQPSHFQTHKNDVCPYCQEHILYGFLEEHVTRCELKPRECEYCETVFGFEERVEHVEVCGNRTWECEMCGMLVKNKEKRKHWEICVGKCLSFPPFFR